MHTNEEKVFLSITDVSGHVRLSEQRLTCARDTKSKPKLITKTRQR